MTSTPATRTAAPVSHDSSSSVVSFGYGLVAALLTTILAHISVVAGIVALVAGTLSWQRHGLSPRAAAGMGMAAVSIYVILMEILVK